MAARRPETCTLAKFGVVGVSGTVVYYTVLWTLVELLRVSVLVATSAAFLLVCVANYVFHNVWTFVSTNAHMVAFPRFLFMNLVGFSINLGIMFAGVEKMALNYLLVQALAIATVVAWNFTLSFFWVFRDSRGLP